MRFVPFHPDEVHLLYQSQDFELLFTDPLSMAWAPGTIPENNYRLIIPPLPKYLLGLGRRLAGYPPSAVSVDWDWSQNMQINRQLGALPPAALFYAARLTTSLLLPLSLIFIYSSGAAISGHDSRGTLTGILAMILLGSHALILLHGRRAMSEGTLIFGITLSILGIFHAERRPWLIGLGVAIAISAKQSAFALIPAGLLAVAWLPRSRPHTWRWMMLNSGQYLGVLALVFGALHPLVWKHSISAVQAMWQARYEWTTLQTETLHAVDRADLILQSPEQRIAGLVFNLYVNPPMFYEIGNYARETAAAEARYLSIPAHNLMRGWVGGGVMLTLTIFGILAGGYRALRTRQGRRPFALLLLATLSQGAFLVLFVFLPAQRYVIPLAPFTSLWIAYGITAALFPQPRYSRNLRRMVG